MRRKWKFWKKEKPVDPCTVIPHDAAAINALERAHESLEKATEHLEEIKDRRERLEHVSRSDYLAPAIYEAFKQRKR